MMFYLTGDKWLDRHIKSCCAFRQELNNSAACLSSSLSSKEIESLQKCMDKVAKISSTVHKRLNKNKK